MRFPDDLVDHVAGEAVIAFVLGYSSAGTRLAYSGDLIQWLRHCRAHELDPMAVRRTDIERYARLLEQHGRAPATVHRRLATICGFYRRCVDEALLGHSPAVNIRRPRR